MKGNNNTSKHGCPSDAGLSSLASGELGAWRARRIAAHVATCPRCTATLERHFAGGSDLVRALRGLDMTDPPTCDDPAGEFRSIRERLAARLSSGETQRWSSVGAPRDGGSASDDSAVLRQPPVRIGRFLVGGEIGAGAMGRVFRAEHEYLRQPAAVKLLRLPANGDERSKQRFVAELEALGRCNHPDVVRAYDAGEIEGALFVIMEFVEGWMLSELQRRLGPLPPGVVAAVGAQAAQGLGALHDAGLVHRDVKPSNLIVTPSGTVKVLDLGLAHLVGGPHAGERVGTPDFMAPEQVASERIDRRTDVYGMGGHALLSQRRGAAVPLATLETRQAERPLRGAGLV